MDQICTKAADNMASNDLTKSIKSVGNHFWWCFAPCQGSLVLLIETWLSILMNVCNIHEFEDNTTFTKCEHGDISP